MKRSLILGSVLVLFLALAASTGFAQAAGLAVSTNKTVVDGAVTPDEYTFKKAYDLLTLYANRTADTLYLAVEGKTTGWVALGLGSLKMDGATIFIGYLDNAGKVQFKPQAGSGHGHGDTTAEVAATVISYAIKQAGDVTTLEIALKATSYIKHGQQTLDLIFAVGADKSLRSRHMYRDSLSLKLL